MNESQPGESRVHTQGSLIERDLHSLNNTVLKAEGIHKSYKSGKGWLEVLTGVDFEIKKGEIFTIVGPSGSGKSTLLHILGALDRPTSGRVIVDSTDVFSLSDDELARFRNQMVGFVFQFHHLLPEFTALENVMMPCLIAYRPPIEATETARELLNKVGLSDRESHRPGELSGGEQQRVAVARALANDPILVLADEPWGNLDRDNAYVLAELIWKLSHDMQKTFVIVTHDLEAAAKANRAAKLTGGKITMYESASVLQGEAHEM